MNQFVLYLMGFVSVVVIIAGGGEIAGGICDARNRTDNA